MQEFGISCLCHPLINCDIVGKGNITLQILRKGRTFGIEVNSESYNEIIDIMPWNDMNGCIKHVISKGNYNPQKYMHEYRKYMGVFSR